MSAAITRGAAAAGGAVTVGTDGGAAASAAAVAGGAGAEPRDTGVTERVRSTAGSTVTARAAAKAAAAAAVAGEAAAGVARPVEDGDDTRTTGPDDTDHTERNRRRKTYSVTNTSWSHSPQNTKENKKLSFA